MVHWNKRMHRPQAGFTLIELMIVVLISAVLLGLGVPGMQDLIANNRTTTQAGKWMNTLALVRSEAVKYNQTVTLCKSTDGAACSTDSGDYWESGWVMFVDEDGDGALDVGETTVQALSGEETGVTIRSDGTNFVNRIMFNSFGGSNTFGTFKICPSNGDAEYGRKVVVSSTGRPRVEAFDTDDTCP